jgi:hypothetical protein
MNRERTNDRWRRWVRDLRTMHPPANGVRVRVRRAPVDRGFGHTDRTRTGFTITVRADLSIDFAGYILEHEWAHMLEWDCGCGVDHCEHWAKRFGALHRDSRHDADHAL